MSAFYPISHVGAYRIRPEKHLRGLVGAFGRMRYAPTWDVCGYSKNLSV